MTDYHRTNIRLYAADAEYLQQLHGRGWTEEVREIVHRAVLVSKTWTKPTTGEISRRYVDNTEVPSDDQTP